MIEIVFQTEYQDSAYPKLTEDPEFAAAVKGVVDMMKYTHDRMPITAKQYKGRLDYQGEVYQLVLNP